MKNLLYILILSATISSCALSNFSTSTSYEDDIYYDQKEKPLAIKEIEKTIPEISKELNMTSLDKAKKEIKKDRKKYADITDEEIRNLKVESISYRKNTITGDVDTIISVMNKGYWLNRFQGSESDLEEAMRKIEMYPNGFGYFGNGQDIARNLSFDSDWNVYTQNGKYWWFPTFSNLAFYNRQFMGDYPRYNWVNTWNSSSFNYNDFDYNFGSRNYWGNYNLYRYNNWRFNSIYGNDYWFRYNNLWNNSYYGNYYDYSPWRWSYAPYYPYRNSNRKISTYRTYKSRGYRSSKTYRTNNNSNNNYKRPRTERRRSTRVGTYNRKRNTERNNTPTTKTRNRSNRSNRSNKR